MFGGLCWLLAHPPRFVELNSNVKKRYIADLSFQHILQKPKDKNRPSKVGFCRHLIKMLLSAVPTGFETATRNYLGAQQIEPLPLFWICWLANRIAYIKWGS